VWVFSDKHRSKSKESFIPVSSIIIGINLLGDDGDHERIEVQDEFLWK